jgi:hypothetical protein
MAKTRDSKPKKSRAKGRTPAEQFATAQRRIEEAREAGATELDLGDLSNLAGLPDFGTFTTLQSLDVSGTQISDLAPLTDLTALVILNLNRTQVSDLAVLADLTALETIHLDGTKVRNLGPLISLAALEFLDLDRTRVSDLAPLAGLTALQTLYLSRTQVSDLAPLADLTALQSLNLSHTRVRDFAPLAGMTEMLDAITSTNAIRRLRANGLEYHGTPIGQKQPFDRLVRLEQPARTVETINEVRRQRGLPEHIPAGDEPPAASDEEPGTSLDPLSGIPSASAFNFRVEGSR